jgi:hypothetical protein
MRSSDAQFTRNTFLRIIRFKFVTSSPLPSGRGPSVGPSYVASVRSYSKRRVRQAHAMLLDGKTIDNVFQALPFPMRPDRTRRRAIKDETATSEVTVYAAFFECLAWVSDPSRDAPSFSELLKLLTKYVSLEQRDEMTLVVSLLVGKYLDDPGLELTGQVITEIADHIMWNPLLTEQFSDVFRRLFIEVMDVADRGEFLKACACFLSQRRAFLDLSTDMIVQLSLPIFKLDQDAIGFLCLAARSLDSIVPQFQTLIGGFPTSMLSMTEQRPPKNKSIAAECVAVAEILPKLECKFIEPGLQISQDAAVEGIEVDDRDLSAFLPETFIASGATTLPNFMKGMKPEYLDCFFGVFEGHLKQAEGSVYYIDFYAIFLYFAFNNDYEGLGTTHIGLWLSPVIFNPCFSVFDSIPVPIQSLRDLIFTIASDQVWIRILCYTATISPFVFAEQCLRVLNEPSKKRLCGLASEPFLTALLWSSRYLQEL